MADWRDRLSPASFRGVAFFYAEADRDGGRRLVNNEFPLRDDNFLEDLGLKAKTYRLAAYVIGNDYDTARDTLEAALDQKGSGTLVHPYKGNLTVGVDTYSVQESPEFGGSARFEITFIQSGSQPSPTSSTNTATAANTASVAQQGILASDFGALYQLHGLQDFIQAALSGNVLSLVDDLTSLAGLPGLPAGIMDDALNDIRLAVEDPFPLGQAIVAFFTGFVAAVSNILPVNDPALTSRGQPPVADPSYGLAAFATWGDDLPPVMGTTPQRLQQAADQAALVSLVQGSAVAAIAQLYANTEFVSANDAETARDQMNDLVDIQATAAADLGDDTAYAGWMTLFSTVSVDLTARALQLPQIMNLTFGASLPALVLAQRIYQDASQAPDLIARNAAPHPLFMPRAIEALAT